VTVLRADLRELGDADRGVIRAMVDADPVGQCVFAARMARARTLTAFDIGGHLWGLDGPGGVEAACFAGGNLMPLGGAADAFHVIGEQLGRRPRTWSSVVGHAADVSALWSGVGDGWGRPRSLRMDQPLLLATEVGPVQPDPLVVRVGPRDLMRYLPAALAMFSEELEIEPPPSGVNSPYRSRLARLIAGGLALARFDDDGRVLFKAEIAAVSAECCQVQGVWVDPNHRNEGLGAAGMAAVIAYGLALAPRVSLYVNDFNVAARRMYDRVGMTQVGTFATILF
jgi:predicted GNAT family acetyltransferase